MKILITGSTGMLGTDITGVLSREHEVIATSKDTLDITEFDKVQNILTDNRPDWVFHLAALTDLDYCEKNPEVAYKVNSKATENIAKICAENSIKMLYVSTSGVFSGDAKKPYDEYDDPNPSSIYGKSKYEGEKVVMKMMGDEDYLILRAGWLFGGGIKDKKFVAKIYKLMKKLDKVKVVADIYGSPNYSFDIGIAILRMLEQDAYGLFHVVNKGIASRYEIAEKILEYGGFDVELEKATAEDFPTVAPRPPMEGIVNKRLQEVLNYQMRNWKEALKSYITRLKNIPQFNKEQ